MKKILTALLAAAMLIVAPAANIFADEPTDQEIAKGTDSATIKLYAALESSYTVKLPIKVSVQNTSTNIPIYAKGNVDGSKKIVVAEKTVSGGHKLVDAAGKKTALALGVTGVEFAGENLTDKYGDASNMVVAHDAITEAGDWGCDLAITISLDDVVKA
mgnify:CR=1 FL=1